MGCGPTQLFHSFLILMPPWISNVAKMFCQYPSKMQRGSSSPSFTQSIICRIIFCVPHTEKCSPSSELLFSTSDLCPLCLLCICCVVFPVYCFLQVLHVIKYITYFDLHVKKFAKKCATLKVQFKSLVLKFSLVFRKTKNQNTVSKFQVFKISCLKISSFKILSFKISSFKISSFKISIFKISSFKISRFKLSSFKISIFKFQVSSFKLSSFKLSSFKF